MERKPAVVLGGAQLTTAVAGGTYTVPANSTLTISAFTLNNTTATPATVTINVVQSGSVSTATQIATNLTIPAMGSAPTIVSGLIGHSIQGGGSIQMLASVGTAITPLVSGYLTTF